MENETKKCKHCQSDIPKKAKVCPNCRKKQGGGIVKWIIIAVVAVGIIGAVGGGGGNEEPKKEFYAVGEVANVDNTVITLKKYEESKGSEWNKPTEGNVFIIAEFEIENNSDSEMSISSMLSFEGYADDYALNYSLSALMERDGANQLDGSVAPGKKMSGIIGYEVPEDWKNVEIHFTDNVWTDDAIKFKIEK